MIFGRTDKERIQLNEDTFWSGQPYDPANPEALKALPEARKLVFEGQYKAAENLINSRMRGNPSGQACYLPVGDLNLAFAGDKPVEDYRRDLDLDTALATVSYMQDGVKFTREIFSSPVDQVIVVSLTADKPRAISFTATLTSPADEITTATEGADTLVMKGTGTSGRNGIKGALKFECRARVLPKGGKLTSTADAITIEGADSVLVLVDAGTGCKNYHDISGDSSAGPRRHIAAAAKKSFDSMLAAHVKEHQRLFRRVSLDLGVTDAVKAPTDDSHRARTTRSFRRFIFNTGATC
jgi:alpha-L-fucosidase 2